ncbi:MAG: fibronectin type III domain-containing protein [Myxococcales bacterium]|nr:fibronectin type III domain-containing protein [Myxococcales bacterium]
MFAEAVRAALVLMFFGVSGQSLTAAPKATTVAASGITTSSAVLNGIGNPSGEATTGRFRYSSTNPGTCNDTFGTRVPTAGGTDLGTGSSPVPYSITTTGLTPGVTYYFCSIVSNASGTSFGAILSFTIPAPPVVVTTGSTMVTSGSATLQGTADPLTSPTTGWFRYGTTNPTACDDSFGTRAPWSGGSSLGSSVGAVAYTTSISGLLPATTYYFCAIAQNGLGTGFGRIESFTTPANAPSVSTNSASSLTRTTGVLNGSANPGGSATTAWFRYATASPGTCNDTFGTRAPASGGSSLGAGTSSANFSQSISGLSSATTYYYCAIAVNAVGTSWGSVQSFTTPSSPTVRTTPASNISNTTATLNGAGNPQRASTTGWFRYAISDPGTCDDKFGSRAPVSGAINLGADIYDVDYLVNISGLSPATTYWYCAIIASSEGTAFGKVMTFTTASAPVAVTNAATNVTSSGAVINGAGNPNGSSASGWFRYYTVDPGTCNDSFGWRIPSSGGTSLGAGNTATPFAQSLSGLSPSTTYYYCAMVNNSYGTSFGAVQSFTTTAMPPTVSTGSASSLTRTTGVLNGYANPGGIATTAWFRYSKVSPGTCNDSFGDRAPGTGGSSLGSGSSSVAFSQAISGLTPATMYYFCAFASNSMGTVVGSVQTFITPASPTARTTPASNISNSSATLNGAGNPQRSAASGWFRYSATNPMTCDDKFGSRAPVSGATNLGADIYDVDYVTNITGLSPGTTYYFCAIVSSTEGIAFGAIQSFTTAGPVTVSTSAATSVTASSAVLNGTGNPNGATAAGWFRYSNTDPGTCNDSFGWRAPYTGNVNLGATATVVPFTQSVTSLSPGTTYYFCAIANNSYGTSFGAVMSFTTPATAPSVSTSGATSLTRTTAVLNGYANPGGIATTAWFRYSKLSPGTCNDSFGDRAPGTGGSALGSGSSGVSFSQAISGLSPATTYYFCAIAANTMGTVLGSVQTFITPGSPTARTTAANNITTTSATLNGAGNPQRAATTGWFRYATSDPGTCDDKFGSRAPVMGGTALGADIYDVDYVTNISGLSSGTTYYYCAIVSSSEGMAFGTIQSFTTSGIPTATTVAASSVTSSSAVLNGTGNPNGAAAIGWFRYSNTDPGTCNDSFGWRAPYTGNSNLGSTAGSVPFAQTVSSLSPGTTYYYCAIASNSYGVGFGAVMTFSTPATAPTVTTSGASNLTRTTGVLNGYANPGGAATTAYFRYDTASPGTCNDSFGKRSPSTGGSSLGSGASSVSFSQSISGLTAATMYYYCAIASNTIGKAFGTVQSFITPSAPTARTTPASNIANTSATLNGAGNPQRAAASGWFRYSTTNPMTCDDKFGSRAPVSGATNLGADIYDVDYVTNITGLSPGTTYYFCAIVSSTEGTAFGTIQSFTTASPPVAITKPATSITASSATLNGEGTPNGSAATGWFRYGNTDPGTCSDSYGTRLPWSGSTSLGAGTTSVPFAGALSSLTPGATYYFCAIVSNGYGTSFGAVQSFKMPATGPAVTTSGASSLTRTTGVLNGYANPGGDATTAWFRYGTASPGTCNDTFGTRAPTTGGSSLGSGTSTVSFSQAISGLSPATTYYYCAIAANSVGTSWGTVQTFITPTAPTALTTPASNITNTTATLNGSGNPNRGATQGWFRYATSDPGTCDDKFGSRAPTSGGVSLGSDIYDQPYSVNIAGLSPATTYYYCAIVSSTEGTAFGAVLTFTTSAPATATTLSASSVASTTATLNGSGNPNGAAATGWFRYSTTSPGTCNDSFGTRMPSSGGTSLGSGTGSVAFGQAITGLSPGVTYYYCAFASNAVGMGMGALLSFTTPASLPTVITEAPSGIAIQLNGTVNPNGAATVGWFRLATTSPGTCNDTFGTRVPTTGGTSLGSGASYVSYQQPAPSLVPGTTYYYCAIASNAVGTSYGVVRSFTAPMPPTVATLAATPVTATTATLNGSGNPNGNSTIAWFRYSTSSPTTCNDVFGTRTPSSGGTSLGAGTSDTPFAQPISGLAPATTYYFCAIASSAYGTVLGSVLSFTTPPSSSIVKPTEPSTGATTSSRVHTMAATEVTADGAVLNGSANPSGEPSTGWFRFDTTDPGTCDDTFGMRTPSQGGTDLGKDHKPVAFSQGLSGLKSGTTYYFCAVASSGEKARFGSVLSFTTQEGTAAITTAPPTEVSEDAAVLNATVAARGETPSRVWFRYSEKNPGACSDTFGIAAEASAGLGASGEGATAYSVAVSGLKRGTTYFVCALAQSAAGTRLGEVLSFVAGEKPPTVVTEDATPIEGTQATVTGTADRSSAPSKVWFRYGESDPGVCDDRFGSHVQASSDTPVDVDSSRGVYSARLAGLKPNTTYYYCIGGSNQGGATFGQVRSFRTGASLAASAALAGDVTVDAVREAPEPVEMRGCSYLPHASERGAQVPLVALLSLLGLLAFRRRLRRS